MIDLEVPVEGVALDALDAFLSSDRSPPDGAALIFDSGPRVIAKTPLDDPQTASPPTVAVAPRIVRSERGLARGLAKEDRHHYRRRRAAWPFAAVNLPFRLARTASRMLAGNWG